MLQNGSDPQQLTDKQKIDALTNIQSTPINPQNKIEFLKKK